MSDENHEIELQIRLTKIECCLNDISKQIEYLQNSMEKQKATATKIQIILGSVVALLGGSGGAILTKLIGT